MRRSSEFVRLALLKPSPRGLDQPGRVAQERVNERRKQTAVVTDGLHEPLQRGRMEHPSSLPVQERGIIPVKSKGKMLTYFLSGRARRHGQMLDLTAPPLVPHQATPAGPATLLTSTHAPGLRGRMLWLRWKMLSGS
jgi:hypothetical protein